MKNFDGEMGTTQPTLKEDNAGFICRMNKSESEDWGLRAATRKKKGRDA